jgi:hypothetical protein
MRGWSSQSATGFRASAPAIPKQRVVATTAPSVRALCASSEISRLLPTPASPVTTSRRDRPSMALFQDSRTWSNSRARPTSRARRASRVRACRGVREADCTMLEHRVLVAGCQCLQCQLLFTVEHAHVDAARRPVSPHQSGRLNDERRVIPKEHAEVVQLSSQVRPRLPLGRIGPEGSGVAEAGVRQRGRRSGCQTIRHTGRRKLRARSFLTVCMGCKLCRPSASCADPRCESGCEALAESPRDRSA